MVIGIYANKLKDENRTQEKKLARALESAGQHCFTVRQSSDLASLRPDVLCVLGGDGTILNMVSSCADADIPILGVNLGSVGFLSEIEPGEMTELAARLAAGDYTVEERSMLQTVYGGKAYTALNEIVVTRDNAADSMSKVITVDAYVGSYLADRYIGDGVIVSTPTGSTAYSLSAGGAVLSPNVAAIQITSICPHSLHTRPIVVGDTETVTLKLQTLSISALLIADGTVCGAVTGDVAITKYRKSARFVKMKNVSFYSRLLDKLNKWSTMKL